MVALIDSKEIINLEGRILLTDVIDLTKCTALPGSSPLCDRNLKKLPEAMDEPLVDTLPDYSEAEVDEAIKEKDLFLDPVVIPERAESKTKRRRRTRVRYTDDEILQMSLHLAKQMELTPRPAMVEVWTAYVAQVSVHCAFPPFMRHHESYM